MLNLTLTQGEKSETIGTTPEHPFYVVGRGFVSAGDLTPGMVIRQVSSDVKSQLLSEVSINALLTVQKPDYGNTPTTVYNFTVADTHTYVVGSSQALVHNACAGDKTPNGLIHTEHSAVTRQGGDRPGFTDQKIDSIVANDRNPVKKRHTRPEDGLIEFRWHYKDARGNIVILDSAKEAIVTMFAPKVRANNWTGDYLPK